MVCPVTAAHWTGDWNEQRVKKTRVGVGVFWKAP